MPNKDKKNNQTIDNTRHGFARGVTGLGTMGMLGNTVQLAASKWAVPKSEGRGNRNSLYGESDATKAGDFRRMSRVAGNHGYEFAGEGVEGGTKWVNKKTGKTVHLSGSHHPLFLGGPHAQGGSKPFPNLFNPDKKEVLEWMKDSFTNFDESTIRLGTSRRMRSTPVLAHEFGHTLQGRLGRWGNVIGKQFNGLGKLGLVVGNIAEAAGADPDTADKIQRYSMYGGVAGGLGTAASEAHASWLGSKGLKPKHRIRSFVGLPTYLAAAAAPAAMYYGSNAIKDAIWGPRRSAKEKTASMQYAVDAFHNPKSETLKAVTSGV